MLRSTLLSGVLLLGLTAAASASDCINGTGTSNKGQCYPTHVNIDPTTGLPATSSGGGGGGGAVTNAGTFAVQNTAATPPGSNTIGSIANPAFGITGAIPAGANTIGSVNALFPTGSQTSSGALQPATAAAGKITLTTTAVAASTNTTIAAANANRIAYGIQCAGTAGVAVSETGATLAAGTFGAAGSTIYIPTGTSPPYFSPPVATRTAITAYTGTAQTCTVTEYNQ